MYIDINKTLKETLKTYKRLMAIGRKDLAIEVLRMGSKVAELQMVNEKLIINNKMKGKQNG